MIRVLGGHVVSVLDGLEAGSIHVVCTSPPYHGLRNYGLPPQTWADGWVGDLGAEATIEAYLGHLLEVFRAVKRVLRDDGTLWVNIAGNFWNDAGGQNGGAGYSDKSTLAGFTSEHTKGRALHRISAKAVEANKQVGRTDRTGRVPKGYWLKALDYVDVPGLFAHAMQRDGWLWRADMALVKRSPMPESVSGTFWTKCRVKVAAQTTATTPYLRDADPTKAHGHQPDGKYLDGTAQWQDCPGCPKCAESEGLVLRRGNGRPTRAWERLLVFAKKAGYYFDTIAVREKNSSPEQLAHNLRYAKEYEAHTNGAANRQPGNVNSVGIHSRPGAIEGGRNLRDWMFWPTSEAQLKSVGGTDHYAAFPPGLPTLAIKAGTSEAGVCPCCGAPWARVVETTRRYVVSEGGAGDKHHVVYADAPVRSDFNPERAAAGAAAGAFSMNQERWHNVSTTLAWRPTCSHTCPGHDQPPRPAVCLDPFGGSGTTGLAADRLGRDCILVDLNPDYTSMAVRRLIADAPLLADVHLEHEPPPDVDDAGEPQSGWQQPTLPLLGPEWAAPHQLEGRP